MSVLLGVYFGTLFATYLSTTFLIILKLGWGPFPHIYLRLIQYFQDSLPIKKTLDIENNNSSAIFIGKRYLTPSLRKEGLHSPFDMSIRLLSSGVESILQDDISRAFLEVPQRGWWMMTSPRYLSNINGKTRCSLYAVYILGLLFRWGFLFPLRVLLILTSLVWITLGGIAALILPLSKEMTLYFGITFARLFNAGTGLVAKIHDKHNRPKAPGIAVSNHLSANDIMIIYANCEYGGVGYTVTGQTHGGFIDPLQKMGSKLTPTLWLDRASQTARTKFQKQVLDYSSNPSIYPVLLFPEGYCTNNDTVLQFRKAVFTGQVPIYPIAILQNTRLGDSFWRENTYIPYILRVMTSWAIAYDIIYLPPIEKRESEDITAFASRVQGSIASCIGKQALPYDGGLKKEKERVKYKTRLQEAIAEVLV